MRRKNLSVIVTMIIASLLMTACGASDSQNVVTEQSTGDREVTAENESTEIAVEQVSMVAKAGDVAKYADAVQIVLSDDGVTVNGEAATTLADNAVYVSNDIIYYEDKDTYESGNPYGEGDEADKHSVDEAAAHTVVNITQPGIYHVTGSLSIGQIFVNVGEEETEKVTLILNGVDITCKVAPAVLFYEVYECDGDATEETATKDVDTMNAGAKVILADGSVNNVSGSYVAKIFKDNEEEKKLHKYDGAFYSKASMEISGEEKGDGILNITAENEGLGSEVHLTINGGNINIQSADDGINTSEDGVSVFMMNSGKLNVQATLGKEGDGIDSNGWLVVNGGTIISSSNSKSMDAGIDSDKGIHINGGTVIACGNMYDHVEDDSTANTMVLQFENGSKGNLIVKDSDDTEIMSFVCEADYSNIVISSEAFKEGEYYVYNGEKQLSHSGRMKGIGGGMPQMPEGFEFAEGEMPPMPEEFEFPEDGKFTDGQRPQMPEGFHFEGGEMPPMPEEFEFPEDGKFAEDQRPQKPEGQKIESDEKSAEFKVQKGVNLFGGIAE